MYVKFFILLIWVFGMKTCYSKVMCKSENNTDLDWYIIIKYPSSYNFFYLSSASNGKSWQLPTYALNDQRNLLSVTLRQAYNSKNEGSFYSFYNDDKPENISGSSGGHLKGVVNFDKETGYWLVHSVPKFPPVKAYDYPNPQHVNGQSFFCVSMKTTHLNSIATQLLMMYARVYDFNLPGDFTKNTTLENNLARLVHNMHSPAEKFRVANFTTVNNVALIHFGKSKLYNADIYADLIAPGIKSSLFVESWRNGNGGRTPSSCKSLYKVMNVLKVKMHNYEFYEYQDHSKWAVTLSHNVNGLCIGDLNRMDSQFRRGGGSLCIFENNVWMAFASSVTEYQKCKNQNVN